MTAGFQSIQSLFGVCSKKWSRQQKHMWLYKHTHLQVYYNLHLNLYSKETYWYIIWNINQHLEYSAIIAMKACVHKASCTSELCLHTLHFTHSVIVKNNLSGPCDLILRLCLGSTSVTPLWPLAFLESITAHGVSSLTQNQLSCSPPRVHSKGLWSALERGSGILKIAKAGETVRVKVELEE